MATFSRNVTVNWEGGIMDGKGTAKAGSGAFSLPVSFPRRIGDAEGVTSPEELIAAARNNVWLAYPMNPAPGQYWVLLVWVALGLAGVLIQLSVTGKQKAVSKK